MTNIQKPSQIKKEAWLTFNQRMTNINNRMMTGANLEENHISDTMKKQLLKSCGCGKQLDIDSNNQMSRRFTCKKRWCRSCARFTAFNRDMSFYPAINAILKANQKDKKHNPRLWLVTLTLPTCEAHELMDRVDHMQKQWRLIYKQMKKSDNKAYCNGLRKLEINANKKKEVKKALKHTDFMYHVHLHVLIQGEGNARYLKKSWLKRHPEASKYAQDIRKFGEENGSLRELLKYLAKPAASGEERRNWTPEAMHKAIAYIYDKLRGKRTMFSYGTVKAAKKWKCEIVKDQLMLLIGDQYVKAFDESEKQMQDKLISFLNAERAQASRPLENTLFKFYKGVYFDVNTGELLCSEKDIVDSVKEADEMANKRKRKKKKEGESTNMDAYKAERKHFKRSHTLKIGDSKESIECIDKKIKRLVKKKKEEERQYIRYKRHKKSPASETEL